jgi:MULE transposase domain
VEEKMSRRGSRPEAKEEKRLEVLVPKCVECGQEMWVAYHKERKIMTLQGLCRLTLVVRSCRNKECSRYKRAYRPEEEGRFALPHGECGLDVIALVGTLRYREHRSIKEIHAQLKERGVQVCERTVEHALHRYEELVAVHLHQKERLHQIFEKQGRVILAIDGLQPDVGHEVLWVIREVISGEILVARAQLRSSQEEIAALLKEAKEMLPDKVAVSGIVSDGQRSIRLAVAEVFPEIAHQLCHFHYLREAATAIYEADRHAKKELKKQVRGIRPIEQSLEGESDQESEVVRDYCLAVRSAITDDGYPPLEASGLKLYDRLKQISASISRVFEKRGAFQNRFYAYSSF